MSEETPSPLTDARDIFEQTKTADFLPIPEPLALDLTKRYLAEGETGFEARQVEKADEQSLVDLSTRIAMVAWTCACSPVSQLALTELCWR